MGGIEVLIFLAVGLFLILPIVTVVLLAKLRGAHEAGIADIRRELRGLRQEIKGLQGTMPRRAAEEPAREAAPKPEIVPPMPPAPAEEAVEAIFLESDEPAERPK